MARNADGIAATLAGALRGENVARYPGGLEGRAADIEAGAGRAMTELLADVRDSANRLDRVFGALVDADATVWDFVADDRPTRAYVAGRWREVEIHRVDLGADYLPSRWPAEFVESTLPEIADGLGSRDGVAPLRIEVAAEGPSPSPLASRTWSVGDPARATDVTGPDWAVLAWLLGRASVAAEALSATPELPPWR